MSKNSFLENIEIKSPCSEDWSEMRGSDEIRFCSHCSKSVNNLSAMTRKQALKVVRGAEGGICVRYVKNPANNKPIFADKFYQITRRAGVAAGVLGASLTLSTLAYAQGGISAIKREGVEISQQQKDSDTSKTEDASGNVSGTVTDPVGAVIPNISVLLVSKKNPEETRVTASNEEGFYEFKNVPAGTYTLKAEGNYGFQPREIENLTVGETENVESNIQMDVSEQTVMVGFLVSVEYENPLHRAVANNDLEEVKSLIAKGESINEKDKNYGNITPLFLAVENGNLETTQILLSFGAKVNARNADRRTPMMLLDEDATPDLVRLLIRYGAKINLVDTEGNTALILASRYAKPEVLQVLLAHGANADAQNKSGQTALMNAADEDNLKNVKTLLEAGASVNVKNRDGETALDLAGGEEIEKLLESYGAIVKEN